LSLTVGDRVQLDQALGTIEKVREDGVTAEVLWDTGASCPVPLDWLTDPEWREAARKVWQAGVRKVARAYRDQQRRELPERDCACECGSTFAPTRADQRYKPGHRQHRKGRVPTPESAGVVG
jgi:hypothetical protein